MSICLRYLLRSQGLRLHDVAFVAIIAIGGLLGKRQKQHFIHGGEVKDGKRREGNRMEISESYFSRYNHEISRDSNESGMDRIGQYLYRSCN